MAKAIKPPKVVHRKLGREKAWGLAYKHSRVIHIDSRLKGKKYLTICLHELLHIYFPELSETKVDETSKGISEDLWKLKFRRTDL